MIEIVCDKCKVHLDTQYDRRRAVTIKSYTEELIKVRHLCESCYDKFRDWLKEKDDE